MKPEIKVVIVDDQPSCIDVLANDLLTYPRFQVTGKFTFALEAIDFIRHNQPDVLFLDMEMPGKSGLELLTNITPFIHAEMAVVFYSGHSQYMQEAIRQSAFDFLLKPYNKSELDFIVCRILNKLKERNTRFLQSVHYLQAYTAKFRILTRDAEMLLSDSEVIYFEVKGKHEGRGWKVRLTDGSTHDLRSTTTNKEIVNISSSFVQVNKQNIINKNYLAAIERRTKRCVFYPPFADITHIYLGGGYSSGIIDEIDLL